MRVVADSHAIFWHLQSSPKLSAPAAQALREAGDHEIVVSVASLIDLWYVTQTTQTITTADLAPVRAALESSPRVELQLIDAAVADAYTAIPRSVLERVAALSAGRMSTEDIVATSKRFLASDLVVRLAPDADRRRPPEWSTVELRAVEDHLLARLTTLTTRTADGIAPQLVEAAIAAEEKALGEDQARAVHMLCGAGSSVRALVAPAGYGKTTALHAAATAAAQAGRWWWWSPPPTRRWPSCGQWGWRPRP